MAILSLAIAMKGLLENSVLFNVLAIVLVLAYNSTIMILTQICLLFWLVSIIVTNLYQSL